MNIQVKDYVQIEDDWYFLKQEQTATDDVIKDLRSREKMGFKKYNKFLTPNTDEDMLQHLFEELLDASLYIKTLINQRADNKSATNQRKLSETK